LMNPLMLSLMLIGYRYTMGSLSDRSAQRAN
jgi:hypothetical protein